MSEHEDDNGTPERLDPRPLPWQRPAWEHLMTAMRADRMPHALLITGPAGVGKAWFARRLVQARLCRRPADDGAGCGECPACHQFLAGTHPDWKSLGIEAKRKNIVIDQVRAISAWLGLTASEAHGKHTLIEPADRMTTGASNSLLKTLEEPQGDTLLLLISSLPGRLSATIRSRCQTVPIPRPDRRTALNWLEQQGRPDVAWEEALDLAGGSPLRAVALAEEGGLERARQNASALIAVGTGRESLIKTAEQWVKQDIGQLMAWWRVWLESLARRLQAGEAYGGVVPGQDSAELQKLMHGIDWKLLHELILEVNAAERRLDSANPQLLIETLLSRWARACGLIEKRPRSREATA